MSSAFTDVCIAHVRHLYLLGSRAVACSGHINRDVGEPPCMEIPNEYVCMSACLE